MRDPNWDMIGGDDAEEIEVLNLSSQINVIKAATKYILFHDANITKYNKRAEVFSRVLLELHRAGTLFLLQTAGQCRVSGSPEVEVVEFATGRVLFKPSRSADVLAHLVAYFDELSASWETRGALFLAAQGLWKINHIHPFQNGNGRTARAFSYLLMCLKYGYVLPGRQTVVDLVMSNRDDYERALRAADATFASAGTADLSEMEQFLGRLLREQLLSAPGLGTDTDPAP